MNEEFRDLYSLFLGLDAKLVWFEGRLCYRLKDFTFPFCLYDDEASDVLAKRWAYEIQESYKFDVRYLS
jgi:hypothetical protein